MPESGAARFFGSDREPDRARGGEPGAPAERLFDVPALLLGELLEESDATGFELRTPVLWGLRTRDPQWHDGRFMGSTRLLDAITAHGEFGSEALRCIALHKALDEILQLLHESHRRLDR